MAKIGFTREQFDRELLALAVLGKNSAHEWRARFGYSQSYLCRACRSFHGVPMKDVFRNMQLRVVRDMVVYSNLTFSQISEIVNRSNPWLSDAYRDYFGENMKETRKNNMWRHMREL